MNTLLLNYSIKNGTALFTTPATEVKNDFPWLEHTEVLM